MNVLNTTELYTSHGWLVLSKLYLNNMMLQKDNKKDSWELEMMAKKNTDWEKPKSLGAQYPVLELEEAWERAVRPFHNCPLTGRRASEFSECAGHSARPTSPAILSMWTCTGPGGEPLSTVSYHRHVHTHLCTNTYTGYSLSATSLPSKSVRPRPCGLRTQKAAERFQGWMDRSSLTVPPWN